ncbi:hypothetical protein [Listeria seeligeri]|uniref:hypothetical protein n=1 Tax=Listeria seeligeri TaxID=1640 RepID=UPI0022EB1EE9|nr:hypothetical protein [Listeria seeligeri]
MTKDILYQAVYWDAIRIIANHFPDQKIDLEVTWKNKEFVFRGPKNLQQQIRFYSVESIKDIFGCSQKAVFHHIIQSLGTTVLGEYRGKKKAENHSIFVKGSLSNTNTKSMEEIQLLHPVYEKIFIMEELGKCEPKSIEEVQLLHSVYEEVYIIGELDKSEPITDAQANLERKIQDLSFFERSEVYKELIYLQHYYEPFYIKKLTTI